MIERKNTFKNLAIVGGKPAFSEKLHVNKPNLGNSDYFTELVKSILESYQFTNNGPLVNRLEEKLAQYLQVKHCVLASNGTIALSLLVKALDLKGEVIIPSFSFISTAHTLMWQGIKPVFCDINQETWNIDPDHCESLITERTSAIIGTHVWGRSCNIERLEAIAEKHNIRLVFDAAHAFGSSHKGKMIGSFGNAEVFSFHSTKAFHTFEGGAITTDDPSLAKQLKVMSNFGFVGYDEVMHLGTNAKMTEICAAMGLTNLQSIDLFFKKNKNVHEKYKQHLSNIPGLKLLEYNESEQNNYQYIVLEVNETIIGLTRDEIINVLHKENILARRYFYPGNHKMEPYNSLYPEIDFELPTTNLVSEQVLLLPGGTSITDDQIIGICSILELTISNARKLLPYLNPDKKEKSNFRFDLTKWLPQHFKITDKKQPTLEIRLPISANEKFLRMVHYFLESLQEFGGPIAKTAKCVVSISRDEPYRDLTIECPWAANYNVEFQWLDQELFDKYTYDATGFHRLDIESEADIVILADADLLITGDLDAIILESFNTQRLLGFIAHVTPFNTAELQKTPSPVWWSKIFKEANLTTPRFTQVHTGWGLMSTDKKHRSCPYYYNYGFIIAPRESFEKMAGTFVADMNAVDRVMEDNWAKSQMANTISCIRHNIPCGAMSINYNFPLHVPDDKIRALNPDSNGQNSAEDVKVFHYLGNGEFNREDFATIKSLEDALQHKDLSASGTVFQQKLQIVHDRIMSKFYNEPLLTKNIQI
ncbi:MAG: aminotransferase class I/II-fold pyridoxal phosphate-dependent enzyme [Saprospiraceae bacterium]|nr:aminotransferase class I/II-fold pyridoxal phosphate-dependent enzyme [Saprospiraceae bacterium]